MSYSHKTKQLVLRLLRPMSKQVIVFRFHFTKEVVSLVGDYSLEERISNIRKRKQQAEQLEFNIRQKQYREEDLKKAQAEIEELKTKLKELQKQHKLA